MGSHLAEPGSPRAVRRGRRRGAKLAVALVALVLVAAWGCATKQEQQVSEGKAKSGPTTGKEARRSGGDREDARAAARSRSGTQPASAPAASRGVHVRLTERGCIEFDPHWATVEVGQSVTWHSDLKKSVTIHVPAGVFGRSTYVVRPGASASSGPALESGAFEMWSQPAACQGVSRGVQGAGPGVSVGPREG